MCCIADIDGIVGLPLNITIAKIQLSFTILFLSVFKTGSESKLCPANKISNLIYSKAVFLFPCKINLIGI